MQQAADRMGQIPFSGIRKMLEKVKRMEQQGKVAIHLEIGCPDFDTPEHIKQAAFQAMCDGEVHYTSNYGIAPLRTAIAEKLLRENGMAYDPSAEIIVTAGVAEGITATMMALLNPGDEVLIVEPLFPSYVMAARMAGAIPVAVPVTAENGYQPRRGELERCLTRRTRMLVVITPGNPTGVVLDETTLTMLADFAIQYDLLVVADEIYEQLIYDGRRHISIGALPGMRCRTVTLNGFSKSYAMPGWRLGYIAADAALVCSIIRIHQYAVVCANTISQWAGVAALTGPRQCLTEMVAEFDHRRRMVVDQLRQIPDISFPNPQGALYVYVDVSELTCDARQLADELLEKAHVAVAPWDKKHIRLSYANSFDNLKEAMERIHGLLVAEPA
jgi:aspartate/methionine/tyrosine aminotransferase